MHLYTYVSLAVVVLSTATLYIILKKNNSKDCRYIIGLGISAVIAIVTSLLLPDIVSAFTVDLAMQLALSFFIAFLLYITLLFFTMMIVAYVFPQKKIDKLREKWEEKRLKKQELKELKQKQKEEAEKAQAIDTKTEIGAESNAYEPVTEETGEEKQREEPAQEPAPKSESILKSIFINRFTRQKVEEILGDPVPEDQENSSENDSIDDEISETVENVFGAPLIDNEIEIDINEDMEQALDASEIIVEPEQEATGNMTDDETEEETAEDSAEEAETAAIMADTEAEEPAEDFSAVYSFNGPLEPGDAEASEPEDIFDQAVVSLEPTIDSNAINEKNVDTPDIIDKMGVDEISDESVPYLDLNGLSLNELIDKAFVLKENGREIEAASLYIEALSRKPDDEAAFWIVLDICSIYKNSGQAELAEDILLTYIDEFEHLMSEEVKDQILQSLYT